LKERLGKERSLGRFEEKQKQKKGRRKESQGDRRNEGGASLSKGKKKPLQAGKAWGTESQIGIKIEKRRRDFNNGGFKTKEPKEGNKLRWNEVIFSKKKREEEEGK